MDFSFGDSNTEKPKSISKEKIKAEIYFRYRWDLDVNLIIWVKDGDYDRLT